MRIALISDIHGNFVALEAVLRDIQRTHADEIICLGDVAVIGPQPKETLAELRSLGCPTVMGNTDAALIHGNAEAAEGPDEVARKTSEVSEWCRKQLSTADLDYIQSFSPTISRDLATGATLLCFHGSPNSYNDIIMWTTPAADLDRMLAGHHATVMAGGHTHVQMMRRHRDTMIVNAGSVGLPYDKNPWSGEVPQDEIRFAPWAEYALITHDGEGTGVELRRVNLDLRRVADAAVASGRPYAKEWAAAWVGRIPLLQALRT